ncbi:MAG: hypothetical protein GX119_06695 [Syntrophomonadaceae bacterium]|jgi:hypothetical protein|nr:hypothetical protein [Syntrophomonadaceae bacterium]
MTPLLFISIVTLVLLLLVYWILSSLEKRPPEYLGNINMAKFETSQELFKYVDQNPMQEEDVLHLEYHEEQLQLFWNISQSTWQLSWDKYAEQEEPPAIVIRLFDGHSQIMDIPVHHMQGRQKIKTGSFQPSYGVLGVKVESDFLPLFLSHGLN